MTRSQSAAALAELPGRLPLPASLPCLLLAVGATLLAGTAAALVARRVASRVRRRARPGRAARNAMTWPVLGRWATGALALLGATAAAPDAGAVGHDAPAPRPSPASDPGTSVGTQRVASGPGVAVMVVEDDPDSPHTSLPVASATAGAALDTDVDTAPSSEPYAPGNPGGAAEGGGAASAEVPDPQAGPEAVPSAAHVVEPGDHLWGIAEAALALRIGREPTDEEVVPYWRTLIDANTDRLVDPANPDLILPGQVIELPD